jgi:hypothetical protein
MKVYKQDSDWHAREAESWAHLPVKFGKNDVNRNRVGVEGVYPGRIEQIELEPANVAVPPALQVVSHKPPDITEEVWAAQARHPVPNDVTLCLSRIANRLGEVFDRLSVKVNFNVRSRSKALKLLRKAALGTMTAVYKRRNDGESQVSGSGAGQVA